MEQSKRGYVPMSTGITLSKSMCPKTQDDRMFDVNYIYILSVLFMYFDNSNA